MNAAGCVTSGATGASDASGASGATGATADGTVAIGDFLRIKSVSAVRFSPDGKKIAFSVTHPDLEANVYRSRIHLLDRESGECVELEATPKDWRFIWIDADTLLFPAVPEPDTAPPPDARSEPDTAPDPASFTNANASDEKPGSIAGGGIRTVFRSLDLRSGRNRELFSLPQTVKRIERRDDGSYLYTAIHDASLPADEGSVECGPEHGLRAGRDFEIVEQLPVWSDGSDFVGKKVTRLYEYRQGGTAIPITDAVTTVESFRAQGSEVLYVAKRQDNAFGSAGIHLYDSGSGITRTLLPENGFAVSCAEFLGDSIVFIGTDRNGGLRTDNPKFYRIGEAGVELLADTDFSVRDTVGYDCKYGEARVCMSSGGHLYFISTHERSSFLKRIDAGGIVETLTPDDGAVQDFDLCGNEAVFSGIRGMSLQELYLLPLGNPTETGEAEMRTARRLTGLNDEALAGRYISPAEPMVFSNHGFDVHYVVCRPAGFDPARKYPAILYIHGGAKVLYGPVFFHEMQVLAGRGYFVVYGNPRGSDGQGGAFARLKGHYGEEDCEDMMKAMDVALERYPQIDADRLAVAGGSYGGIMTNWIVGHTTRFKCALADRSLCNMISAFGTADNGYDFVREQMDADPWKDLEKLWAQSPLKYAPDVRTPLMLIHSELDRRCHYSEAVQFFTALRFFGVEAKMLFVRGECHDLSRTGRPRQRLLRLGEIVKWFEAHLD